MAFVLARFRASSFWETILCPSAAALDFLLPPIPKGIFSAAVPDSTCVTLSVSSGGGSVLMGIVLAFNVILGFIFAGDSVAVVLVEGEAMIVVVSRGRRESEVGKGSGETEES